MLTQFPYNVRNFGEYLVMKKILLILTGILICSAANAQEQVDANVYGDITNPFYMPLKNRALSHTSLVYHRDDYKYGFGTDRREETYLNEEFSFGVSNNFALTGTLGNRFEASEDMRNVYWGFGGVYALDMAQYPDILTLIGASYKQEGSRRDLSAFVRVGYTPDAVVMPYAEFRFTQPVNYGKDRNEAYYDVRVAGYSMIKETVAVRAGFDASYHHEDAREQAYSVFGEAEYVLSDRMAVGVNGSYLFHDTGVDTSGFSVGANFKIAF